jgi:hypothetical protein
MTDADDRTPPYALYRGTSSELATPVVADAAGVVDALPADDDPQGFVLVVRREMQDSTLADRLRRLVEELERNGPVMDSTDPQGRTVWAPTRAGEAAVARISLDD